MRKLSGKQKSMRMAVLTALVIVIIFANSVLSMEQSGQISSLVTTWLRRWLSPIFGIVLTEHFVRKSAHIIEYFILGIFLTLFFRKVSVKPFFTALLIAVMDESLQIFSHRGSSLIDVWIDFISAVVGICLVLVIKKGSAHNAKAAQNEK